MRYSHVVDPRTGFGLTNRITAHVIAAATADALATALIVDSPSRRPGILSRFDKVAAFISE